MKIEENSVNDNNILSRFLVYFFFILFYFLIVNNMTNKLPKKGNI